MKNIIKIVRLILLLFVWQNIGAQQITVAPAHLLCSYEVPINLDNQVKSKLQLALTKYGISSEIGMSRFAMVPEVVINNEHTTSTIPVYCNIDFDLVITLTDIYTGKSFGTYVRKTMGKGTSKSNAISKGISVINLNNPEFEFFCESSKNKIITYYSENMPSIIARANAVASSRDFQQAISMLCEIPDEVQGYSTKVGPLIGKYYTKEIDLEGESVLNEALAAWAQSPDESGANEVADILSKMPPGCSSSQGARDLMNQIRKTVKALNDRQFAFEKQQADREYALERQRQSNAHAENMSSIASARAIGVAWAKNQPKTITNVYLW